VNRLIQGFRLSKTGSALLDTGKPMSTLAFEKRWNPVLNLDRSGFVEKI